MKKILALAIAVMMICVCAFSVSAAQTTLSDVDCAGWWTAHSEGVEITAEGVTITFTSTSYETATENWHGPLWILYTGDEAKVNGAGYVEYWVQRGDNYGWCVASQYYGVDLNRWSDAAALADKGISFTDAFAEGFDWANYLAALKAGAEVKITAQLDGSNVLVTTEVAGITNNATLPIDASKPVYLSLSGELAKLTNIVVTTADAPVDPEPTPDPEPNPNEPPKTGDMIGVVVALMAISGAALVTLKKKH